MIELILRADDIGYSEAVNYGIAKTVKEGLIGSAGLMCNMPYAAQGVELLKDTDICLGQHTNVCLGTPCADLSLIPSLVQTNGQFKSSREYREAYKHGTDLINIDEAVIEVEAQYFRFKELTGKEPEYFEAHAIASSNLQEALRIVAEQFDLPFNDMNPMMENGMFKGHPIHALPMGSMDAEYDPLACLKNGIINHVRTDMPNVFVCHPGWLDQYLLNHSSLTVNRTKEVDMLCSQETKQWLEEHRIKRIKYRDIV